MPTLLLSGGSQVAALARIPAEWSLYGSARLVLLDTGTGEATTALTYETSPAFTPPRPSHVFKGTSTVGSNVVAVTQTEVVIVGRDTWAVLKVISHPAFNDLHHCIGLDDHWYVASTGLDCVIVLDKTCEAVRFLSTADGEVWARFRRDVDYRLVPTTKPHLSHPNHLFVADGEVWVTRFEQRDAVGTESHRRLPIHVGKPHDGVVDGNLVWFTTVNGHVVAVHIETGAVHSDYNLNEIEKCAEGDLGWCRGLLFEDGIAYVGFSRIRPTLLSQNISWARRRGRRCPTRIVAYHLPSSRRLREWDLERVGLNAVFGLLSVR